jgi:hypothetical protein
MSDPELSVCIVTFQARQLLADCLRSLFENTRCSLEVIIVDNGSTDGTQDFLAREYPHLQFIQNARNEGYTRPMNQALRPARGRWLVQLNPDTLVHPAALDTLIAYMEANPTVGISGPKVLNRDGTLQAPCRRGDPRPWAVLSYFLGLSRLFPKSRFFGEYLLNYLDEDQPHPAAGVSGSCMLIRRAVVEQIGYLDELFFAYQEDADYCARARQAGWQVHYVPQARITHYGGQGGSRVQPYRAIIEWHRSYYNYYRKHLARDYFFLFNWVYYLLMALKLGLALAANFLRRDKTASTRRP